MLNVTKPHIFLAREVQTKYCKMWHCTVCAMLPSPTKINKTHGRDGGTGVLSTVFYVLMCHDNSKIQD